MEQAIVEDHRFQLFRRQLLEDERFNDVFPVAERDAIGANIFMPGGFLISTLWRYLVVKGGLAWEPDLLDEILERSREAWERQGFRLTLIFPLFGLSGAAKVPEIAFSGGWLLHLHAAESLVLARYQMFVQVYYQHTRRAFDHHVEGAIRELLKIEGRCGDNQMAHFPPPTSTASIRDYLQWDDWKVVGMMGAGLGGHHARALVERNHDSCVYHTTEVPSIRELEALQEITGELDDLVSFLDAAEKSWYAAGEEDVAVLCDPGHTDERVKRLSKLSSIIAGLKPVKQKRVYVPRQHKEEAIKKVSDYPRGRDSY